MVPTMNHILLINTKFDPVAWLIRLWTHSQYNHCAWILNSHLIVESTRGGIKINHINKYRNPLLYRTKKIYIKQLSNIDKKLINNLLTNQVHSVSYIKRFFVFILVALKIHPKSKIPTCSSFIASACSKLGIYFNESKPLEFITPEDINTSKEVNNG